MQESQKVLIVGGGLVGCEMAAEIKELYPKKHVVLVESNNRVMKRIQLSASVKIYNFLVKLGIEVRLNERVVTFNSKKSVYKTSKSEISADCIYLCTGE